MLGVFACRVPLDSSCPRPRQRDVQMRQQEAGKVSSPRRHDRPVRRPAALQTRRSTRSTLLCAVRPGAGVPAVDRTLIPVRTVDGGQSRGAAAARQPHPFGAVPTNTELFLTGRVTEPTSPEQHPPLGAARVDNQPLYTPVTTVPRPMT